MRSSVFWFLSVLLLFSCTEKEKPALEAYNIIPIPQSVEYQEGLLEFNRVNIDCDSSLMEEAIIAGTLYGDFLNYPVKIGTDGAPIKLNKLIKSSNPEAYFLTVDENGVTISGASELGVMHGLQTLRQMLYQAYRVDEDHIRLPAVVIKDFPQFRHRGLLLDCCRHFMEKDFVLRYVDLLSAHKMNILHWHLTEDQGWRIEIDKYPLLTETGAWRTEADGSKYGGFYTKDEIHEVVAYAAERGITVIPEIELPGHSSAAIASYPWLSCTGEQIPVENEWGVFKDIYCAGNDSTLQFLKDVMDEVMELFPSEYIHIGGDEAPKFRWENCDKCQNRIKTMGLHDEHELQSWFVSEMGEYLEANGRKMIGWDEILEGGLPEGATIQSWRGIEGGIAAAQAEHEAIMSPTSHCYFDYGLDATDMAEVYEFDPVPEELTEEQSKWIIGGECNMWSERAPQETVDSKVFPRILAMSEVLWSYPLERDFEAFSERVKTHYAFLDFLDVDYGFETVPVTVEYDFNEAERVGYVIADQSADDVNLSYREIGEEKWWPYTEMLPVTEEAHLEFQVERNGKTYDKPVEAHFVSHRGIGQPFQLNHTYSKWYTGGGDTALVDGVQGSLNFRDGHWQALQENNIDVVIDLGEVTAIKGFDSRYYQYNNAWIFLPASVDYMISADGENWSTAAQVDHEIPLTEKDQMILGFRADGQWSARYVRMVGHNMGPNPEWHDSPGMPSWLFCDEFVVR